MSSLVGDESLGAFARHQVEAARRDPRVDRTDGQAAFADFRDALEEVERLRTLGLWGLQELALALQRAEERLGVGADAPHLDATQRAELQVAFERAELAAAEMSNGSPGANAQALIGMNSALDAMVEELVKSWRSHLVEQIVQQVLAKAREAARTFPGHGSASVLAAAEDVARAEVEDRVPKALRPRGVGIRRYEKPLGRVGWAAPPDRPIPADLDAALKEMGALRDVLVHRAGRVDAEALRSAPTLQYRLGQFVRLSREDFRIYSAAVRCYGEEIVFRGVRDWPEVDEQDGPDLAGWRDYVSLNA
jgi:hypothetical protein